MTNKSIAVVDPMWTGRFFVRAIYEAGFRPVVIFPMIDNERIANDDYALAKEYTDKYSPITTVRFKTPVNRADYRCCHHEVVMDVEKTPVKWGCSRKA
jgi:hypothetical protein